MFTCVQNGKGKSAICIPQWAEAHEVFAAEELARYIKQITGADLEVRRSLRRLPQNAIIIADLSHPATPKLLPQGIGDGLRYDGFRVRTVDGRLYIVSHDAYGVVFGTYEYLRRCCGCGFLDYGERGETIPHTRTISHSRVDLLDNPAFWYRAMQVRVLDEPEEILHKRIDWMAKNGYCHLLAQSGTAPGLFSPSSDTFWGRYRSWLIPALAKRGIKLSLGHHNFHILIPNDQYLKERPDFFARIGGKRVTPGQLQWCLSNSDLVETVSKRVIDFARCNPEAETIQLWPSDGLGPVCECRECAKLDSPRDQEDTDWENLYGQREDRLGRRGDRRKMRRYLHLANEVADRLSEVYPKVKLCINAYVDLADPPSGDLDVHPNIMVFLALYWHDSKRAINDPKSFINRQYVEMIGEWLKVIEPESLCMTTYEAGMGAWKSLPFPVVSHIFNDWGWFKQLGLGGGKTNAYTKHLGVYGMNYSALSRARREESPTLDEFMDDYCQTFFGEAAQPIATLYRKWEYCMQHARAPEVRPAPLLYLDKIFSKRDLQESRRLCDHALALTDDSIYRWRIERVRAQIEYCQINREAPASALIKYWETRKVTAKEMAEIKTWLARDREFVRKHLIMEDDLFTRNYAEDMLERWLLQI